MKPREAARPKGRRAESTKGIQIEEEIAGAALIVKSWADTVGR